MNKRAFFNIILAGLLWGTSGIFVHFLAPMGYSSIQMSAMRATVSAIVIGVYALVSNKSLFKVSIKELLMFLVSGTFIFLTATLYYASMQMSSVSTAVMLMYTAPIFVLIYSVLFLGEQLNSVKILSVFGMIAGCALVSGVIGGMKFNVMGILLGLASGVSYAIYNIVTKIQMRHGSNPLSATLYNFIFMAVIALLSCNAPKMLELTAIKPMTAIPLMIGIGIFTCITPYFLYTLAIKELPVGVASALGIIEPMAATIYSVVFFREQLGLLPACGIVLIMLSVVLLGRSKE